MLPKVPGFGVASAVALVVQSRLRSQKTDLNPGFTTTSCCLIVCSLISITVHLCMPYTLSRPRLGAFTFCSVALGSMTKGKPYRHWYE